jgi:hypothetical protein
MSDGFVSAPSRIPVPRSVRNGTSSTGSGSVRDPSLTLMLDSCAPMAPRDSTFTFADSQWLE